MTTSSEKQAREGLELVIAERDVAQRDLQRAESTIKRMAKEITKLEDQLYGSVARCATSFYSAVVEEDYSFDGYRVSLRPRAVQHTFRRADFMDARNPVGVVSHGIDRVVEMVAADLKDQLRAAAWQACRR